MLCFLQNTVIEFKDKTVGTNVPKNFVPGIKKGFQDFCQKGPLSGSQIIGEYIHFKAKTTSNLYKYDKVGKTDTLQMYPRPAATTLCRVATLVCPVGYN